MAFFEKLYQIKDETGRLSQSVLAKLNENFKVLEMTLLGNLTSDNIKDGSVNDSSISSSSTWNAASDNAKKAIDDAITAQGTADLKIETFYQDISPHDEYLNVPDNDVYNKYIGDMWYDTTSTSNNTYRYCKIANGENWDYKWRKLAISKDTFDIIDGKRTVYTPYNFDTLPSIYKERDLMIPSDDIHVDNITFNKKEMYIAVYDNTNFIKTDWVIATKYTDDSKADEALQLAIGAQETADGQIQGFFQITSPSIYNKDTHTGDAMFGDIWIDIDGHNPPTIADIYRCEDSNHKSSGTLSWYSSSTNAIGIIYLNAYIAQLSANTAATAASNAAISANTANSLLADIANDNKLTPLEKQIVKKEWDVISSERSGIDSLASTYNITTDRTNYNNMFQALADYLNNGNTWSSGTPALFDSLTTTTDIVGEVFRSYFSIYYYYKTNLLNTISNSAKTIASSAQTSANNAMAAAASAQGTASNAQTIASGKITTYYQTSMPTNNTAVGDYWIDIDDNNHMYRANCVGASAIVTTGNGWYSIRDKGVTRSSVTFIIADGSTSSNINNADYIVPAGATNAQTIINQAISNLPAAGGKIILLDGTYIVNDSIILNNNLIFEGSGPGTVVKPAYNYSSNSQLSGLPSSCMYMIHNSGSYIYNNIEIRNMTLTTAYSSTSYNCLLSVIGFAGGASNLVVDNVNFSYCRGNVGVIYTGYNSSNINIINCSMLHTQSDAVFIYASKNVKVTGCSFNDCNFSPAINSYLSSANIINNIINGTYIYAYGSSSNLIISNNIINNSFTHGIYADSISNITISNNSITGSGNAVNAVASNIYLRYSSYNTIQSNICRKGSLTYKSKYGICISESTSVGNQVTNNDLHDSGTDGCISDSGTGTITTSGNRL